MTLIHWTTLPFICALLGAVGGLAHAAVSTPLATAGRALAPIVIPVNASAETKAMATTLAEYLGRISGAKFAVQTGGGAAQTTWADGVPMTIESSFDRPGGFHGRRTLYFYVPLGTKTIGGFSEGPGTLRNESGAVARKFDAKPGFFGIPVPPGEDGRLWLFEQCAGDKRLMTVPPFLARSGAELLLPRETVEKDSPPGVPRAPAK